MMLVIAMSARGLIFALFIIAALGKQQSKSSRVVCALKKNSHCVNWVIYGVESMSQDEITTMADDFEQECKENGQASEAKVVGVDTLNYRCVPFCEREGCRKAVGGKGEL